MTINGADASAYGVVGIRDLKIKPAATVVYSDWMRKSFNPINYDSKQTFKEIEFTARIEAASENEAQQDISNLSHELIKCTLKFDGNEFSYECTLTDADPAYITEGIYELDVSLQSSYAYLPAVTETGPAITGQGNLPSPAVVTLTPSQDVGSVTLTGLSSHPITVKNLHAGAPVVIDGENGLVTEPDLDNVMTEDMGAGKWMFRKYSIATILDPDYGHVDIVPAKGLIPANTPYTQMLISDAADLRHNQDGYDYLALFKTGVYVLSGKSITIKFLHDDGINLYVDGASRYSIGHPENNGTVSNWTGYPSVSVSLTAGWHTIEFLLIQHYGPSGLWGFSPTLSSQVDQLNAYHAREADPGGTVNKFPDTDMWEWPVIQPGDQTINVDNPAVTAEVKYKPKFM